MNLSLYQKRSQAFSQWQPWHPQYGRERHRRYGVISLAGESGEVADIIKKVEFNGHAFNRAKFVEECGDTMWSLACLCEAHGFDLGKLGGSCRVPDDNSIALSATCGRIAYAWSLYGKVDQFDLLSALRSLRDCCGAYGVSLEEVMEANIAKLSRRYPSGKYSDADSIARRDVEGAR